MTSIFLWPQWCETRNQLQEEKLEKHKQVETKQHATKKNQWVYEEIKKEIRKYLKANENGNTTLQNLWDEIQAYLKK